MPSRRKRIEKRENRTKPYVPLAILRYAVRNAAWTVSPGATVLKSEAIPETVQNAYPTLTYLKKRGTVWRKETREDESSNIMEE